MKNWLVIVHFCIQGSGFLMAQQNWSAVLPCFQPSNEAIDKMFVDSLHNQIVLNSNSGHKACNIDYKGVFAFDGSKFIDLDFGVDKFDPNLSSGGTKMLCSTTFGNRTLFGGAFYSVGSDTLYSKSIALWNGNVWDTFPSKVFDNNPNGTGGSIWGFLKTGGKLWMYGVFDTIGGIPAKNIASFDGSAFTADDIPVPNQFNYNIRKVVEYKGKLIAIGDFYDATFSISRVAIFDGSTWSSLGSGIKGSTSFVYDIAVFKDTLYIAGTWPKSQGNPSNYLMKWDGNQLYDANFDTQYSATNFITSLLPHGDRLYCFGSFNRVAGTKAFGVTYYSNGSWITPNDSVHNNGIRDAVLYNNTIYVSGNFKSISGDTLIRNFAKLNCPDFDASVGCISSIKTEYHEPKVSLFPNPSKDKLNFEFLDVLPSKTAIEVHNALGQLVFKSEFTGKSYSINCHSWTSGVYFVSYDSNVGNNTFKVLKE